MSGEKLKRSELLKNSSKSKKPPQNTELSGKVLHLVMDDGNEYVISFLSGETLSHARRGQDFEFTQYKCVKDDPEIYMISFFAEDSAGNVCVTYVIDIETSYVTCIEARVGVCKARKDLVSHNITFGAVKRAGMPLETMRHGYTNELVGKKIAWSYSEAVKLTHIYMSERYIRSSLRDMPPMDEHTTPEQRRDIEDRAMRWSRDFFEEEGFFIKIRENRYLVGFIESFRNRVNPTTGGGDILFLINTDEIRDYIRSFSIPKNGAPRIFMGMAKGEFIEEPDEMESAKSPYRLE